jgi:hypothetical protein
VFGKASQQDETRAAPSYNDWFKHARRIFYLLHSPRILPAIYSKHSMSHSHDSTHEQEKKRPKNMAGYRLKEYVTAIFQLTEESPLAANFHRPHSKVVSDSYFIRSILLHLWLLRRLGHARTLRAPDCGQLFCQPLLQGPLTPFPAASEHNC